MKNFTSIVGTFALALFPLLPVTAQSVTEPQLAFPGAEGFGRYAVGGRYGEVYHVTNLNDSGEGSLRDAVSQPNRIVVFDVSGVIHAKSVIPFAKNLTIAAQTAPGNGIVIYGNRVSFSGADNIICRYLRVRYGYEESPGGYVDAAGVAFGSNMIFDHLSVTWGTDECFSINGDSKRPDDQPRNITIQNSIMGQGLWDHSCGGLMQTSDENGITLFRNLYIDNKTRNNKVKGLNQFVNNVIYNWGDGGAYIMGDTDAASLADIQNNYFIEGKSERYLVRYNGGTPENPVTQSFRPTVPFTRAKPAFVTYFAGNYFDNNRDGKLDGRLLTREDCNRYQPDSAIPEGGQQLTPTFLDGPSEKHPVIGAKMTAEEAYHWVVDNVGAILPVRDEVDAYMIDELTSLGTKGQIIDTEMSLPTRGPGEILRGVKLPDTDNDGIPDAWEEQNGLDKNDPTDAMKIAADGYANIENYINSIDAPMPFLACPSTMEATADHTTITLSWKDYSDEEEGYILEQRDAQGTFAEVAKLPVNTTSHTVSDLTPGVLYAFRLKAYNTTTESIYSDVLEVATKRLLVAPDQCIEPSPEIDAILSFNASKDITLSWKNETHPDNGVTTYKVYAGTEKNKLECISGAEAQEATSLTLKADPSKTYYWRVDALNVKNEVTTGTVWSFMTQTLDAKEPVMYLSLDGTLKNFADVAGAKDAELVELEPTYVAGKNEQGLLLENVVTGSCISVPYYEGMKFEGGSGTADPAASFSVSMWVKSDGSCPVDGKGFLFHKGTFKDSKGKARWCGAEIRNNELYFAVSQNGTKHEIKLVSGDAFKNIFNNEWHHLVFVRSHEEQALIAYCDGKLLGKRDSNRAYMNSEVGIVFGNVMEKLNEPFAGTLDELKLFRGTLMAEEVANLFETGNTAGIPTSINQELAINSELGIYPSPFFNHFYIVVPQEEVSVKICLYDASGRLALSREVKADNGTAYIGELIGLAGGIYVVSVETSTGVITKTALKK